MADGGAASRIEADGLGPVSVPADARFGPQTARAVANFPVSRPGMTLGAHPELVVALLQIKRAAAVVNAELGILDGPRSARIVAAVDQLLEAPIDPADFPVHLLHGGGGTSANMNVNEVVARVATTAAAPVIDPLVHVNRSQSTNDVYPSACRLALLDDLDGLVAEVRAGRRALQVLEERHGDLPRLARTCLRDAVASTYGTLFGAQGQAWERAAGRLVSRRVALVTLNLGGGVAGQPVASPPGFGPAVVAELGRARGEELRQAPHLADAAQHADDLLDLAHALEAFARVLMKQAQDLRLLASGPDGGLGEILLPAVQPGSSALPGKVNPVIPEFVIQCAMQTIAGATACGMAVSSAELDLNVWEGVTYSNLASSLALLGSCVGVLRTRCLEGLVVVDHVGRERAAVLTSRVAAAVQAGSYAEGAALHAAETAGVEGDAEP